MTRKSQLLDDLSARGLRVRPLEEVLPRADLENRSVQSAATADNPSNASADTTEVLVRLGRAFEFVPVNGRAGWVTGYLGCGRSDPTYDDEAVMNGALRLWAGRPPNLNGRDGCRVFRPASFGVENKGRRWRPREVGIETPQACQSAP